MRKVIPLDKAYKGYLFDREGGGEVSRKQKQYKEEADRLAQENYAKEKELRRILEDSRGHDIGTDYWAPEKLCPHGVTPNECNACGGAK